MPPTWNGLLLHGLMLRIPSTSSTTAQSLSEAALKTAAIEATPNNPHGLWPRVRHFIGGYSSGVALVLAGHTFDTVKVRMQTDSTGRFNGPLHCVVKTVKEEGFLALYKGVTPPLLATGFVNSLLFGIQGIVIRNIAVDPTKPQPTDAMKAALVSGFALSFLVAPMEGIKARLQVQYSGIGAAPRYTGPIDCIRKVYANLGLRHGIYRGWFPTLLCRLSNYSYFGSYAMIQKYLNKDNVAADGTPKPPTFARSVFAGGSAGIIYWLSCYPMDVVKGRMQAAKDITPPVYKNTRDCIRQIYAQSGLRGFTVGFAPCALRAFPANAAAFATFEMVMKMLPP